MGGIEQKHRVPHSIGYVGVYANTPRMRRTANPKITLTINGQILQKEHGIGLKHCTTLLQKSSTKFRTDRGKIEELCSFDHAVVRQAEHYHDI